MKARASIFGVPLEGGTTREVIVAATCGRLPFWVVTANAEILLAAQEDPSYAAVLRQASWRALDGSGPQMVLRLQGQRIARVAGVDLAEGLLAEAAEQEWKVAFFGSNPAVLEQVRAHWQAKYPQGLFRGWSGGEVDAQGNEDIQTKQDREALEAWQPDLLLVAMGGGQKQERWIAQQVARWPWLHVVVGVGGAFDMWAGVLPRAPRWMRILGLEWLWRLRLQPHRWRRIYRAVWVFPWRVWRTSKQVC